MSKLDKLIISAITSVFSLTAINTFAAENNSITEKSLQKCYGIVKMGKNDCATAKQSCAGSSTKDNQFDAYIFLPIGACEKIVGGSLTVKTKK